MTIAFEAKYVDCGDAIDGEILQVTFDSVAESEDWKNRRDPYVLIGQNFEFPGTPTIEWHDGDDYDGGAEVLKVSLTRTSVIIDTDKDVDFSLALFASDEEFSQLTDFLTRIFEGNDILKIS